MGKRGVWIWATVLGAVFFLACTLPICLFQGEEEKWHCPPLPESFQESDLIGIWQAQYFPRRVTDTLILREDGTYRQIYENTLSNYYYSGPWKKWYTEYRPSGGLYLHLEGMRYCVGISETCRRSEGGGGHYSYYDPCERRAIWDMYDEVILAVTGPLPSPGPPPPRGIMLRHMMTDPDSGSRFFTLLEDGAIQEALGQERALAADKGNK